MNAGKQYQPSYSDYASTSPSDGLPLRVSSTLNLPLLPATAFNPPGERIDPELPTDYGSSYTPWSPYLGSGYGTEYPSTTNDNSTTNCVCPPVYHQPNVPCYWPQPYGNKPYGTGTSNQQFIYIQQPHILPFPPFPFEDFKAFATTKRAVLEPLKQTTTQSSILSSSSSNELLKTDLNATDDCIENC